VRLPTAYIILERPAAAICRCGSRAPYDPGITSGCPRKRRETKDGECRVIPEEAKVVKHVFKEYLRLGSISEVVRLLKGEGVVNRRGKPFSIQAVSYMLRNAFYAGKVSYGDIETKGSHEPIITPSLFGKVQAKLRPARTVSAK
jgi:hypothetical protein